jgi:hypothetical protein
MIERAAGIPGCGEKGDSDLEGSEFELMRGVQQLGVAGDKGALAGTGGGPGQGGGELERVGGFEGEAVEEALGLVAEAGGGSYFPPVVTYLVEDYERLDLSVRGKLTDSEQTAEGAADFDWSCPPDDDCVLLAQGFSAYASRLLNAKRDESA